MGWRSANFAFSTANPNTVAAATATSSLGVLDGSRTGAEQRGVYISTNAGQSWTFETSVKDGSTSIAPYESVTSVIYNAAAAKFYAAFRYHGFYSSTDGANWTRLPAQPPRWNWPEQRRELPRHRSTTITCPFIERNRSRFRYPRSNEM